MADDRLRAGLDLDVLDRHLLLPPSASSWRVGAKKFERVLQVVVATDLRLIDVLRASKALRSCLSRSAVGENLQFPRLNKTLIRRDEHCFEYP